MNELSVSQALLLSIEIQRLVGEQFQYWLAITFAVIIAAHATKTTLQRPARLGIGLLYFGSCILFIWLYVENGFEFIRLAQYLEEQSDLYKSSSSLAPAVIRLTIWIMGSGFALWYLMIGSTKE